jgi:hypothetical protein
MGTIEEMQIFTKALRKLLLELKIGIILPTAFLKKDTNMELLMELTK